MCSNYSALFGCDRTTNILDVDFLNFFMVAGLPFISFRLMKKTSSYYKNLLRLALDNPLKNVVGQFL